MRALLVLLWASSAVAEPERSPSLSAEQLNVLERLIATTPDSSPEKPALLFRRATLALELADQNSARAEPGALERRNLWMLTGIKQLIELTDRFPTWEHADEALFTLTQALTKVQKQDAALKYFKRLIAYHPRSRYIGDALIAFGEFFFDRGELDNAEKFFEKAITVARPALIDYARYKLAWCAVRENQDALAVERFTPVAHGAAEPLQTEARKDLLRAFAHGGAPDEARALMERIDPDRADALLDQLAAEYRAAGRSDACRKLARGVACD